MTSIGVKVEGLQAIIRKTNPKILNAPLRNFFKRAAIAVQGRARTNAPVDTGRLRSSIVYEIDDEMPPTFAKVGTNVAYAPFMEFGTGAMSDGPSPSAWHNPPPAALDTWAKRHGFKNGWQVAKIISNRGGLKPRRFLRKGFEDSLAEIRGFIKQLQSDIVAEWNKS